MSAADRRDVERVAGELAAKMAAITAQMDLARSYVTAAFHELMTPLANARCGLELALEAAPDPARDRAAMAEALAEVVHLAQLAQDMMMLAARPLDPRLPATSCTVADVVSEAVRDSRGPSSDRIRLAVHVDDGEVLGHAGDLARLVRNLIDNAVEHAAPGSTIDVRASFADEVGDGGSWVEIAIENDGPGVPEGLRDAIFTPFVRGAGRPGHGRRGAGLGLALAREIARSHGGDVLRAPDAPRTRFVARLPAASAPRSRPERVE